MAVLDRAPALAAPNWYLAAGCVVQTVWNVVTGQPPTAGIKDYDLMYFDGTDLSWEAEDKVIQRATAVFTGIPAKVEVRTRPRAPHPHPAPRHRHPPRRHPERLAQNGQRRFCGRQTTRAVSWRTGTSSCR
ncbi:nucleotidyltransferase family protein [Actinokineospora iranica]|uniref:nucleotidyltransferase family protein n=1 Tax=Actinokineospora iranica TaxID=1271860 RepID=UPI000B83EC93|nr:nucleotidyltransferase family protein [Actinokineospora iranica]